MKKIILLMIIVLNLCLYACNKTDDDINQDNDQLDNNQTELQENNTYDIPYFDFGVEDPRLETEAESNERKEKWLIKVFHHHIDIYEESHKLGLSMAEYMITYLNNDLNEYQLDYYNDEERCFQMYNYYLERIKEYEEKNK